MTQPAHAIDMRPLLAQLLDEQFSNEELDSTLSDDERLPWHLWEQSLYAPLAELVSRPGKQLRGRLVDAGWSLGGGRGLPPPELAAIVESLHAGSLVIDDIEDGSPYRRGAPALHVSHGLPTALNAGCWLYFWPHSLLERVALPASLELSARRRIAETLLLCHFGQALDLGIRVFDVSPTDLPRVVHGVTRLKTGALTELAAALGAIGAGARADLMNAIARFGRQLGIGLQMLDDLSGLVRDDRCHKAHEDLLAARPIWPFVWSLRDAAPGDAEQLIRMSREVHARDLHPEHLAQELRLCLGPDPARHARAVLVSALDQLELLLGRSPTSIEMRRMVEEMEQAYV